MLAVSEGRAVAARLWRGRLNRARLLHLFALKDDPYESQGESFAVYFLAVLHNEEYDHPVENRALSELSDAINRELGYAYVATIYVRSRQLVLADFGPYPGQNAMCVPYSR